LPFAVFVFAFIPGVTGLYGRRVSLAPDPPGAPAPLGVNASTRPGGGDVIPDAAAAAAAPLALPRFLPLDFEPDFEPDFAPEAGPLPFPRPAALALAGVLKLPPFLLRTLATPADLTCRMLAAVATALGLTLPPAAPPFLDEVEVGEGSALDSVIVGGAAACSPPAVVSVRGRKALGTNMARGACCR